MKTACDNKIDLESTPVPISVPLITYIKNTNHPDPLQTLENAQNSTGVSS